VTPRYVRYLYSNDRYDEIERLLSRSRTANTDGNAASYQATSLLWLSKFVPSVGRADLTWVAVAFGWRSWRSWAALSILGVAALLVGRARWHRRGVVVAIAALTGMILESVLLVHYQLKHGVVFRDLGVLLMSVMGGLAAGAWGAGLLVAARGAGAVAAADRVPHGAAESAGAVSQARAPRAAGARLLSACCSVSPPSARSPRPASAPATARA
jgi:hypothetical protein